MSGTHGIEVVDFSGKTSRLDSTFTPVAILGTLSIKIKKSGYESVTKKFDGMPPEASLMVFQKQGDLLMSSTEYYDDAIMVCNVDTDDVNKTVTLRQTYYEAVCRRPDDCNDYLVGSEVSVYVVARFNDRPEALGYGIDLPAHGANAWISTEMPTFVNIFKGSVVAGTEKAVSIFTGISVAEFPNPPTVFVRDSGFNTLSAGCIEEVGYWKIRVGRADTNYPQSSSTDYPEHDRPAKDGVVDVLLFGALPDFKATGYGMAMYSPKGKLMYWSKYPPMQMRGFLPYPRHKSGKTSVPNHREVMIPPASIDAYYDFPIIEYNMKIAADGTSYAAPYYDIFNVLPNTYTPPNWGPNQCPYVYYSDYF